LKPVVFIAGGAGGIGSATAERFLAGEWTVVLCDRDAARLADVSTRLNVASAITADLCTKSECTRAVQRAVAEHGRLNMLVNAAGIWREGPVDQTSEDDFALVMDVNVKATYFLCAAAIPHLRTTKGAIVNLSSDAGLQGNTGAALYCASKGAVAIFSKALALDLAPDGVRVNAICPGDVMSPMLEFQAKTYGDPTPESYLAKLLAGYPQGKTARFIQPREIAEFIWFLAQPEAAAITGACLSIDFGLTAGK